LPYLRAAFNSTFGGETFGGETTMSFVTMGWQEALLLTLSGALVLGGTIAVIVSLYRDEQRRKLGHFDARVGRNVYADRRGLTKP
jgi:hypothetical protein